jgi:hypothetical protein
MSLGYGTTAGAQQTTISPNGMFGVSLIAEFQMLMRKKRERRL